MQEHIRNNLTRLQMDGIYRRFLDAPPNQRKAIAAVLALIFVSGVIIIAALPMVTTASQTNVLANGSFEHGFRSIPGCGVVGAQWGCFTNGGAANYGFYDDQWELVVADGKHSQLIEINTKGLAAADADRYAGIYQTVKVDSHTKYRFNMRGMIRTTNQDGDPWRYRIEVGWTKGPHADWRNVDNWTDAGWDTYYERTKPGGFSSFQTGLVPGSDVITIYIRVWKKWGVPNHELDVNLDSISLVGPSMSHDGTGGPEARSYRGSVRVQEPMAPEPAAPHPMEPEQPKAEWQPIPSAPATCSGPELVYNGDFEHGFNRTAWGEVGRGWGAFTNGGAANYGFYDEQWAPVISTNGGNMSYGHNKWGMDKDNGHGQLIEINTKGVNPADADRYAGIYQHITGLKPGTTYKISLLGLLRGEGNEDDPYRFEAQWGITDGPSSDWRDVSHWESMDLGPIYPRTEPQALGSYTARFRAPSSHIVLYIRGWNKWAITDVEMDFNLDDISLQGCETSGSMAPSAHGGNTGHPDNKSTCTYVVRSGDSLAGIAGKYNVTLQELVDANGIANPNLIFVGQELEIPGCQVNGPTTMPVNGSEPDSEPVRSVPEPTLPLAVTAPVSASEPDGQPSVMYIPEPPLLAERTPVVSVPDNSSAEPESQSSVMYIPETLPPPAPRIPGARNESVEIMPDSPPPSSRGNADTYTVVRGDSLSEIAGQFGTDARTLASVNGINNMNLIYAGQVLQIP